MSNKKYGSNLRGAAITDSMQQLGAFGKEILGDGNLTSTEGVVFRQLYLVSDCKIAEITDGDAPDGQIDLLTGVSLPVGMVLFGSFSDITLESGIMVCYKEGHSRTFNPRAV